MNRNGADGATLYAGVLKRDPRNFDALRGLGLVRYQEGRLDEAADLLARAASRNPRSASAQSALGRVLLALGRFGESVAHYRRALSLGEATADILADLGAAQLEMQDADGAVASFRRALDLDPGCLAARQGLGDALEAMGRREEAAGAFEAAVSHAPRNGLLHRRLAECRRHQADDPHIAEMQALLAEGGGLPEVDQVHLHAGLAKAFEDLGDHDRAFGHVVEGNRIQRERFAYDEEATLGLLQRIETRFTGELLREKAGLGHGSSSPVFIIGMPRSGSTLVEQVLASHSKVHGAGEIRNFDAALTGLGFGRFETDGFFDALPSLARKHFYRLGTAYLGSIDGAPAAAARVTNKLLGNFLYAGLIHLALPNAKLVHIVRDPVDTCVSRFSRVMVPGQAYSYDLGELGRYHMAYERLMAHWRAVLPPGVMLDVAYEDMVADLETQARRLLEFCGLDWEPACLDFHRTERLVMTPSRSQVRQPLYGGAVGRWRRHAAALGPLLEALGRAAD